MLKNTFFVINTIFFHFTPPNPLNYPPGRPDSLMGGEHCTMDFTTEATVVSGWGCGVWDVK